MKMKEKRVIIFAFFLVYTVFFIGCDNRKPEGWEKITTAEGTNRIIGTFYGKYSYDKDSYIYFFIDKNNDVLDISIWKDKEHKVYFNTDDLYLNVRIKDSNNHIIALCARSSPSGDGVRIFSKEKAPAELIHALPLIVVDLYADNGGYLEDLVDFFIYSDIVEMDIGGEGTAYSFTIDTTGFAELYKDL
jgi:hypothetical protein